MSHDRISLYIGGLTLMAAAVPAHAATPVGQEAEHCASLKTIGLGPDISVTSAALVSPPFKIVDPDMGAER